MPPKEIITFERIFDEKHRVSYRGDLWGAAYLLNGGCSDDGFDYFRGWLIGQGKTIYENALADPESLAELPEFPEIVECEDLLYVASSAYEQRMNKEMPPSEQHAWPEITFDWTQENVDEKFPRLSARIEELFEKMENAEE